MTFNGEETAEAVPEAVAPQQVATAVAKVIAEAPFAEQQNTKQTGPELEQLQQKQHQRQQQQPTPCKEEEVLAQESGPCSSVSTDSPDSQSMELSTGTQASQPSKFSPARLQESCVHANLGQGMVRAKHMDKQQKADGGILDTFAEGGGLPATGGLNTKLARIENRIVANLDQFFDDERCWHLMALEVKRSSTLPSSVKSLGRVGKQKCFFRVQVPKPYPGVQCRKSKNGERHPKYAVNGAVVFGTVEDDGEWLKISSSIFLPMRVGLIQILEPLPEALNKGCKEFKAERKAEIQNDRWCCCRNETTGCETVEAQGLPDCTRDGMLPPQDRAELDIERPEHKAQPRAWRGPDHQ